MKKIFLILLAFTVLIQTCSWANESDEPIQGLRWRTLGPLRAGWSLVAEGIPDELNTFYFGGADGGVWRTTDSGLTWDPISDAAPFSSVSALALTPGKPRIIYAGTGQVHTRYDIMNGTGVYKTEDEGKSWTSLGLSDTQHIGRILIDPRNPNIILVAALGHIFGPNKERGVFRSTNGGKNWEHVLFLNENTGAVDLALDRDAPAVVYAALWQLREYPWQSYFIPEIGPGSGIWKSTDGGIRWKQTSRKGLPEVPLSRIGLAVAPKTNGQRIYASVHAETGAGLYRSDDGGDSWKRMNDSSGLTGTYMNRLTTDPLNPDMVYIMGQSVRFSEDGGKSITILKGSPGGDDYHFMWINPDHPEYRVLASDQGTTVSVNGGRTWSPWYNQATGQFYHLAADNRFPYRVYSGQQDSGTVGVLSRSDYGQLTFRDWHPVGGDERDYDIPDPEDPNIVYGSGLGGRLSKWNAINGRVSNVSPWPVSSYAANPRTVRYRYTWITPIAISSHPPYPMYQGAQVLFRSVDKGQSWKIISPDLSGPDPAAKDCDTNVPLERATACGYGVIFSISPSPVAEKQIWIGTDNGKIQLTKNEGENWENVTPSLIKDWSKIASVDASPTDAATAYVAVDRHRLDDRRPYIYRTHDFGKTWKAIADGIPDESWVNVVRQDLVQPGLLYAGTRTGVFVSFDDGDHWQPLQLNLARSGVNDLLVHGNDLIAATQGRAIWVLDDVTPLRHFRMNANFEGLIPPAPAIRVSRNENRDTPLPPEFPTTANPPSGAVIDYYLVQQASQPVKLEILDSHGTIVVTFRSDDNPERPKAERYFAERWLLPYSAPPNRKGHNRFVWNLRYQRPKTDEYEYSIAAVPGVDTPALPEGMLVLPGDYTLRVTADGKSWTQTLTVKQDPRSKATLENMQAQLAFYQEVNATLALATGKKNQLKTPDKKLDRILNGLTSLSIDLEGADGPPTTAQRELYSELKSAF